MLVLEASDRAGGVIRTLVDGGFTFECGPTTVPAASPSLRTLIRMLGLEARLVWSESASSRRFVWRDGGLHELPRGPGGLLGSDLLGPADKLRLLWEPFVRRGVGAEESLGDFVGRRFGRGVVDAFLEPFVKGVYAGDVDVLGAEAMPRLLDLEREYGSVLWGALRGRRQGVGALGRGLVSFPGGLEELTEAAAKHLGQRVRFGVRVSALELHGDSMHVHTTGGGEDSALDARRVVIATPAEPAGRLLDTLEPGLGRSLIDIPHPEVVAVALGYRCATPPECMNAFGFLCAGAAPGPGQTHILGALFPSSIFAERAPEGSVSAKVMLGGTSHPEVAEMTDQDLVGTARRAMEALTTLKDPVTEHVFRYPRAIPQLLPGHAARLREMRQRLCAWPGLALAGSYLAGVGVEACVSSGFTSVAASS